MSSLLSPATSPCVMVSSGSTKTWTAPRPWPAVHAPRPGAAIRTSAGRTWRRRGTRAFKPVLLGLSRRLRRPLSSGLAGRLVDGPARGTWGGRVFRGLDARANPGELERLYAVHHPAHGGRVVPDAAVEVEPRVAIVHT